MRLGAGQTAKFAGLAFFSLGCSSAFAQTAAERVEITGLRTQGTALTQPSTAGSRLGLTPLDTAGSVSVLVPARRTHGARRHRADGDSG